MTSWLRGWLLIALGGVAALSILLGHAERSMGVNLGATDMIVFTASVAAGMWLIAKHRDDVFAEDMSIIERRAWIGVVAFVAILANYTLDFMALADRGSIPREWDDLFPRQFIPRFVLLLGVWGLCSDLVARDEYIEEDERDLQYRRRADRAANIALNVMVVLAIMLLTSPWPVPLDLTWWLSPIVLANLLIGLLLTRMFVEQLVLVISYRRA